MFVLSYPWSSHAHTFLWGPCLLGVCPAGWGHVCACASSRSCIWFGLSDLVIACVRMSSIGLIPWRQSAVVNVMCYVHCMFCYDVIGRSTELWAILILQAQFLCVLFSFSITKTVYDQGRRQKKFQGRAQKSVWNILRVIILILSIVLSKLCEWLFKET